ncbi:MAG: GrpB family protein [Anaerolineales bacterium]|nr:GrpB family protein [Anaerolineales bacterium]
MIIIHDYNPLWPQEFATLRQSLRLVLGSLAERIDHIGSTSVPGLGAKDVIDIQVTVRALSPEIVERMTAAGYRQSRHTRDHVPAGEDEDPRLWTKMLFTEPEGERRANVHVRIAGNPNQQYPLLFRDYLRAHPRAARSIERIKREIARRHADDVETYYDIKDPVYDLIWEAAQEWAIYTNWQPAHTTQPPIS